MSTFTDLSSAVAKTLASTNKVLIKDPADELNWGYNTVEEIKDYVLTQYPNPFQYFRGFQATFGANIQIAEGYFGNYNLPSFVKTFGLFVKGTGNGAFAIPLVKDRIWFGFLVEEIATGDLDYIADNNAAGSNIPVAWTALKILHSFYLTNTGAYEEGIKQPYEIDVFGVEGVPLPKDYISEVQIVSKGATSIVLDGVECRDNQNLVNLKTIYQKTIDITGLLDDTQYYIFLSKNSGEEAVFEISTSPTNASTAYDYTRLIGFIETYDFTVSSQYNFWSVLEKWEDENFDIASIAKPNSIETDAPTYEDLFSTGIKVACFSASSNQFVSGGKEFPHAGQNDSYIVWHAHCYPENTNTGDVVLFVDYAIINEGDVINAAAVTRITKTFTMGGTAGANETINFAAHTGDLQEGAQIWFKFGRLATDGADDFTGKLAVRTFGFHYIRDKNGSDLMLTNL
jgi:hypothetical protein